MRVLSNVRESGWQKAGVVALLIAACGASDTSVFLTVTGDAPGAVRLQVKLIGAQGPLPGEHQFSTAGMVKLPGSISIRTPNDQGRLGIVMWAEDAAGEIVGMARSQSCVPVPSGTESRYQIALSWPPAGFSPDFANDCYCDPANPTGDMCPQGGRPNTGGNGGSVSQPGGSGGATAGTGGGGASGGSAGTPGAGGGAGQPMTGGGSGGGMAGAGGSAMAGAGGSAMAGAGGSAMAGSGGAGGSAGAGGMPVGNALFSFDTMGDWTSMETDVMLDTALKNEGAASLVFVPNGKTTIRSRAFATSELMGVTGRLSIDVHVEQAQGHEHSMEMSFECQSANVYNAYLMYQGLVNLPANQWGRLTFDLPEPVRTALSGTHMGCRLWIVHTGLGKVRYDNLGFI